MLRVNRRLLAWIVSIGLGCPAVGIVLWEAWPDLFPLSGGFGAVNATGHSGVADFCRDRKWSHAARGGRHALRL